MAASCFSSPSVPPPSSRSSWPAGAATTNSPCSARCARSRRWSATNCRSSSRCLPVVMVVGSLSPDAIVAAQGGYSFGIVPHWFVFTPWGAAAFILFFVSGLVESNRTPFDVPEGESEIVAGHMTEYSGFKYAIFFLARILRHVRHQRTGRDALPRRLACADRVSSSSFPLTSGSSPSSACCSSSSSGFAERCRACASIR